MINNALSKADLFELRAALKYRRLHSVASSQDVSHSIASILNLPVEIKQKIAMKLNAKDYASLRESCLTMSQDIDSFSVLSNKIKLNSCTQKYEEKIKKIILSQLVRRIMASDERCYISHILEHVSVDKSTYSGCLFMATSFFIPPQKELSAIELSNYHLNWVRNGFILFNNEMSHLIENPKIIKYQKSKYPFVPWVVGVKFDDDFICYSQLKECFISLSHIFNKVNGKEKLLIAVIADAFKSFWCKNIPSGLVKEDIFESAREAVDLFTVANEIKCIIKGSLTGI